MSGRWIEKTSPWSSLLVLDHAINSVSEIEWEHRPSELNELNKLDSELDTAQNSLRTLIKQASELGIDNKALEAALEGDDKQLSSIATDANKSSDSIAKLNKNISDSIRKLSSLVEIRAEMLRKMEKKLPAELKIVTSHHSKSRTTGRRTNVKTLKRHLGRYTAYEWEDQYEGVYANFNWQNTLDEGYQSSKKVLIGTSDIQSTELELYRGSLKKLEKMRRQADEASVRVSEEKLKRERDRAIIEMLRKRGYKMNRKVVGKKVKVSAYKYDSN